MIVEIKKEIELNGQCWFKVYADGKYVTSFAFKLNVAESNIYNEELAYKEALELAHRIEQGQTKLVETVYKTPAMPEPSDLAEVPYIDPADDLPW